MLWIRLSGYDHVYWVARPYLAEIGDLAVAVGGLRSSGLAGRVNRGVLEVASILHEANILIPQPPQFHRPLVCAAAAALAVLDDKPTPKQRQRVKNWYWRNLLQEHPPSGDPASLRNAASDLLTWLQRPGTSRPTLGQALSRERLLATTKVGSPLFLALRALVLSKNPLDWATGEPILHLVIQDREAAKLDAHHIFPRSYANHSGISETMCDSIVNKTMIGSSTNRSVGGHAPSIYLERIVARRGVTKRALDRRLTSHLVDPDYLWADDFHGFLYKRADALLAEVERVTR